MATKSNSVHVPWAAFSFSILGLVLCAYLAFPGNSTANCLSLGCTVFQNFQIFGVSLWWIGVGYFFILSLACLQGKQIFAWWLARIALTIDACLLVVMLFFAPCANCLVVACFFAITLILVRPKSTAWAKAPTSPTFLIAIWLGLFLANSTLLLNSAIPLWSIDKNEKTDIQIFFSPSCSSCQKAVQTFGKIAKFYPVSEKPEDLLAIYRLNTLIKQGLPVNEAFAKILDPSLELPAPSSAEKAILTLVLMRNKVALLRQGSGVVPLIQINGMPEALVGQKLNLEQSPVIDGVQPLPSASPIVSPLPTSENLPVKPENNIDANLWENTEIGNCQQGSTVPCP